MSKFDSIRPYDDSEVSFVLSRLVKDRDLQHLLISSSPILSKLSNFPLINLVAGQLLNYRAKKIKTIKDYQDIFKNIIDEVIANTINNFKVEGLDFIDKNKSYLFISNHRDITLDSALLNYSLHKNNIKTTNNAVGNNLLEESWASDLMRLNKSFIIDRSGKSKRAIYDSLNISSAFIQDRILDKNESIWIAQKQGRAKDGIDVTDPSVLKMIHLKSRKSNTIAESLNSLSVVPVAISYEYDPNDIFKAKEVFANTNGIQHTKAKGEDLGSISNGITQDKGDVFLSIGEQIHFEGDSYSDCATKITESINSLYKNHPTNHVADILLNNRKVTANDIDEHYFNAYTYLQNKMSYIPEEMHDTFLRQYSNSL